MAAFRDCKWCGGKGCLACDGERQKAQERALEPLFVADPSNPHDMKLLKDFFGRESVERAFSEGDGTLLQGWYRRGAQTIEFNAAVASLLQTLHDNENVEKEEE